MVFTASYVGTSGLHVFVLPLLCSSLIIKSPSEVDVFICKKPVFSYLGTVI